MLSNIFLICAFSSSVDAFRLATSEEILVAPSNTPEEIALSNISRWNVKMYLEIDELRSDVSTAQFEAWMNDSIPDGLLGDPIFFVLKQTPSGVNETIPLASTEGEDGKGLENHAMWQLAEEFNLTLSINSSTHSREVNLLRVPKAGSSTLSTLARRIAGCNPRGPCCGGRAVAMGACPRSGDMGCAKVSGCTGHSAFHPSGSKRVSMTTLRHPFTRAISAFFYPGHHPKCAYSDDVEMGECFKKFMESSYSTPMVNQLSGKAVYGKRAPDSFIQRAKESLAKVDFVGITEAWDLSVVTFFAMNERARPMFLEDVTAIDSGYARSNHLNYKEKGEYLKARFGSDVERFLHPEMEVYREGLARFCEDLKSTGLWNSSTTKEFVQQNSADLHATCSSATLKKQ